MSLYIQWYNSESISWNTAIISNRDYRVSKCSHHEEACMIAELAEDCALAIHHHVHSFRTLLHSMTVFGWCEGSIFLVSKLMHIDVLHQICLSYQYKSNIPWTWYTSKHSLPLNVIPLVCNIYFLFCVVDFKPKLWLAWQHHNCFSDFKRLPSLLRRTLYNWWVVFPMISKTTCV